MTREAKIGLLVGLVFLIAIGVLLSDHVINATNPTPATISQVINDVHAAIGTPGGADKNNGIVATPPPVEPQSPVSVSAEVDQGQQRGSATVTVHSPPARTPIDIIDNNGPTMGNSNVPPRTQVYVPPVSPSNGAEAVPLDNTAVHRSPEVERAAGIGTRELESSVPPGASTSTAVKMVEYKALAGDTVAKMAKRFYGADTKANRDLIINANTTLKADPRKIVIGKTYNVPQKSDSTVSHGALAATGSPTTAPSVGTPAAAVPAGPERVYTVKAGDNIWKIAREQMRDANGVDAIRKLNRDVLKNGDALKIGMKLRLPPAKGN